LENIWNKIDTEIGYVFNTAEKALRKPTRQRRTWSPALARAGKLKRYWRNRLAKAQEGEADALTATEKRLRIQDDATDNIEILKERYNAATKYFASMISRDVQLREDHLNTLQAQLSQNPDPAIKEEIKALRALQRTEKAQRVFKKIRNTLKPIRSGNISKVDIPKDLAAHLHKVGPSTTPLTCNDKEIATILQQVICHKRTEDEEWITIIDQPTLEKTALLYCQQHFQQAQNTPFGSGHLHNLLNGSGLTSAGQQILKGSWNEQNIDSSSKVLQAFITQLVIPEQLRDAQPICLEITMAEYGEAIKKWDKRTSTSPSGRHLGFYKAILPLDAIKQDMCTMLNVVVRAGLVPR
jgi:hypothetical protein